MIPNMAIERWLVFKIFKYGHETLWLVFKISKYCHKTWFYLWNLCWQHEQNLSSLIWDPYKLFIASRWVNIKLESHLSWKLHWINPFKRYQDFLSKKVKCVLITIVSSNINELIKTTSLVKNFTSTKRTKCLQANKNKKCSSKNI